jgi:hypothetical protein
MAFWETAIATFGFPIVMVGVFIWFIYQIYKHQREDRERHNNAAIEREEKLYSQISECREINKKAIETLSQYAERLGTIETDVKEIKNIVLNK